MEHASLLTSLPGIDSLPALPPSVHRPLHSLSDDELLRRLAEVLKQSRRVEADLVAHIGEVEARRLYAREASPSMFVYCTQVLHLSEPEAYLRIAAARAARVYPALLAMLGDGRLHLSGIALLVPHLTRENAEALLARAAHGSKRQIAELVAELAPRPAAPTVARRLPERRPTTGAPGHGGHVPLPLVPSALPMPVARPLPSAPALPGLPSSSASEGSPGLQLRPDGVGAPMPPGSSTSSEPGPASTAVQVLSPGRYKIQFTASAEFREKLERLQARMWSNVPGGDRAAILEQVVTEKLERLEAKRFAKTAAPRKGPSETDVDAPARYIPAAVRRAVFSRDAGRCRYRDDRGRRCPERIRLEFHHRHPYGMGGDRSPRNIMLLCKTHNLYLADHDFGRKTMALHGGARTGASGDLAARAGPARSEGTGQCSR